jgi:hypothetical protein
VRLVDRGLQCDDVGVLELQVLVVLPGDSGVAGCAQMMLDGESGFSQCVTEVD